MDIWRRDALMAASFLTRIPFPQPHPFDRTLMQAAWCFPVIGALIGLSGGLLLLVLLILGIPQLISAFIMMAFLATLTGGLHEDGLADTADGLGGGNDKASKIAIMRDSHIGTYGTLSLIIIYGIKAGAIMSLVEQPHAIVPIFALISAHCVSRFLILPVTHFLNLASETGMAKFAGKAKWRTIMYGLIITISILVLMLPISKVLVILTLASLAVLGLALVVNFLIGGYNGDTLGAAQQVAETVILIYLASAAG